jgi:uncharacterized protein (DUF433 family)
MRMRVKDALELLAAGVSKAEILKDYPYLESEDIRAALAFAASVLYAFRTSLGGRPIIGTPQLDD